MIVLNKVVRLLICWGITNRITIPSNAGNLAVLNHRNWENRITPLKVPIKI